MSVKIEQVVIREVGDRGLHVWSDLSIAALRNIDGVCDAYELNGLAAASLDPRYDKARVIEAIREEATKSADTEPVS